MKNVKILLDLQEIMSRSWIVEREKQKVPLEVADLKSLYEEREAKFLATRQEFEQLQKEKRRNGRSRRSGRRSREPRRS